MARRRRVTDTEAAAVAEIQIAPRHELYDIHSIKPYSKNPRDNTGAVDSVAKSIRNFGFNVPIIIDADAIIVAGHTRYLAAQQLRMSEVPCIRANHLTPAQVQAFRNIDNKVAELAKWDQDLLAEELGALADMGFDIQGYGWSQEYIDCLSGMVADDCLSAGVAAGDEVSRQQGAAAPAQRGPDRTRLVIGEFVIFIPSAAYKQWANEVRVEGDYDEKEIEAILLERLGVTPYLD